MDALKRIAALGGIAVVGIMLSGCTVSGALPKPPQKPTASSAATEPAPDATDEVSSDEWLTSALLMQAAQPEAWLDEWYDDICSSVLVATGDQNCADQATAGAMMAHRAVDKVEDLLGAGAPLEDLMPIAEEGRAAGEAYFAAGCDREPTTSCIGPVDDIVSMIRDYADTVRGIIDEGQ